MKNTTSIMELKSMFVRNKHLWMRLFPITIESWSTVVSFMLAIVKMVLYRLKRLRKVSPINVFHMDKLFSVSPDHFRNNDEDDDQYHDVSHDVNSSLRSSY